MKKILASLLCGSSLAALSAAQSATFNFNSAPAQPVDTFTSNGFSLEIAGLFSASSLNQNLSSVSLNATPYNILVGPENGIGTGPFSDSELRNGAGTPKLSGATLLDITDIQTPKATTASELDILMSSVDQATHEGFLVYGSNQSALKGPATLTLLNHGTSGPNDTGSFTVNSNLLKQYTNFYVTADNSFYSSVLLGNGTKVKAQATPEPTTLVGIALLTLPLLRKRKKSL